MRASRYILELEVLCHLHSGSFHRVFLCSLLIIIDVKPPFATVIRDENSRFTIIVSRPFDPGLLVLAGPDDKYLRSRPQTLFILVLMYRVYHRCLGKPSTQ